MNYIPEIAKMLGVEIGEEFEIWYKNETRSPGSPYHFTRETLINRMGSEVEEMLISLLKGKAYIKKLPFEPKEGETYWHVKCSGRITNSLYVGDTYDRMAKFCGNCFRTKEAAEAHKDEILEKLGVKK